MEGSAVVSVQGKPWAKLVALNKSYHDVNITDDTLLLGRAPECGYRFKDPKVSKKHCLISRKRSNDSTSPEADGTSCSVFLRDLSANGTYVDGKKVGKDNQVDLPDGAEVSLAFPAHTKNSSCIAFIFQELHPEHSMFEEEGTQELEEDDVCEEVSHSKEGPSSDNDISAAVNASEMEEDKDSHVVSTKEAQPSSADCPLDSTEPKTAPEAAVTNTTVTTTTTTTSAPMDDESQNASKRKRAESPEPKTTKLSEPESKKLKKYEEIYEDNLVCGICQDLLYKTVTLIPCLHNFCACCYSDWLKRSNKCPSCRDKVKQVRRNHAICSLVDSYLEANPEKKRDSEELKEMDARCTLTDEMLRTGKVRPSHTPKDMDEEDEEESESESSDSEDDRGSLPSLSYPRPAFSFGVPYLSTGFYSSPAPAFSTYATYCRQCSTPGPDGFSCPRDGSASHRTCSVCLQPFPNRTDVTAPHNCDLCNKIFCDPYWGCTNLAGKGALKKLADHTMTALPGTCLNSNTYEQQILNNYLSAKGESIDQLYHNILKGLDDGTFSYNDVLTGISVKSDSVGCLGCANRLFNALVYEYRASLSDDELPKEVTSRSNCHWGKSCRTQHHNLAHAQRYNHICEQTRW